MHFLVEYMLVPGIIENWVNIIDMGNQGLRELPLKALFKFIGILQKVYKCRLAYSFVVNPPNSMYYIWTCAKPFIDKATQAKVVIENKGFSQIMLDLYEPYQLEQRFGGFAPNLETFWPPVFPESYSEPSLEKPKKKKKKEKKAKKTKKNKKTKQAAKSEDESVALLDEKLEQSESEQEILKDLRNSISCESVKDIKEYQSEIEEEVFEKFEENSFQASKAKSEEKIEEELEIKVLEKESEKSLPKEIGNIDFHESDWTNCGCKIASCNVI